MNKIRTVFIIVIWFTIIGNYRLYFSGTDFWFEGNSKILTETFLNLRKIIIYAGPLLLYLLVFQKKKFSDAFPWFFRWFKSKWVYIIWIAWWTIIFVRKQYAIDAWYEDLFVYGVFFVLITNSIVEEWVYRGYLLDLFNTKYAFWKANIIQGLGFAAVHIPFYILKIGTMKQIVVQGLEINHYFALIIGLGNLFIMAFLLWMITKKTKSLWPAIVLHSLHNGVLVFG